MMLYKEAVQAMSEIHIRQSKGKSDTENDHREADNILCEFLEMQGHHILVQIYKDIRKWYE